ncbi:rod shape-determining protein MreD [Pararhodonellum marinum]|uniref:rod shape-determining protein MreD n=1 Tax=Pararhodonellum marinum TaxID=2755358 RepID=UPI00188E6EC1|nr:rod shape-determining protein MreD [Pararhodonellum marinum]
MSNKYLFNTLTGFFVYLIVQVFLLKNLVLFGTAFCFLHVVFILLLPIETKTTPAMLIAFSLGLGVDIFYDTLGMHTAALVLVAALRSNWIKVLTPRGGYDEDLIPSVLNMGVGWWLSYSLPLLLLYHFLFFYIDNLGTDLYLPVLFKTISSTLFTFLMGMIVQVLFYKRKRGI